VVAAAASSVAVTSSSNPAAFREPITFTATVTPATATGTVQFKIDGTLVSTPATVSGGVARLTGIAFLGAGSHTVTADYSGDAGNDPSTGTLAGGQKVNKGATTTTVTSSKNPLGLGEDVTFTATVSPSSATGTVLFKVDGEEIERVTVQNGGKAELEMTAEDSPGTSSVVAEYSGDFDYAPSSGTLPGGQVVVANKTATTTKIGISLNSVQQAEAMSFEATVSPAAATGTVQFKIDGNNLGAPVPLSGGKAKIGPTALTPGNHTVTAQYGGDAGHSPSSDTANFNAPPRQKAETSVKVTYGVNTAQMWKAVTFHAAVTPVTAGGTVQFKLDGKDIGSPVALKDGVANSAPVSLTPGSHKVEAEYSGDAGHLPSRGAMDKINVPSEKPKVLPRTGSSTVPLALLAGAFLVAGVLIQRKADRIDAAKMPPEDYRY
jgi:hypothetical protein